jgi:hypothetical protein
MALYLVGETIDAKSAHRRSQAAAPMLDTLVSIVKTRSSALAGAI